MNPLLRNSRLKLSQGIIFWREVGKGPTLVFLHGSWSDGDEWLPLMERLGGEYHCLAPDLLGFGESEQPDVHYSIALQVEYLAEYLDALNLRQVYLVGHSLGGWIAASYALKYPDRVTGMVLLAPEGVKPEGASRNWWWARALIERPKLADWLLRSLQKLLKLKVIGRLGKIRLFLKQLQQMLETPAACQLLFQRRRAEIQAELLQDQLPDLKIPVSILENEQDTPTAKALCQIYAELIPKAQLKTLSSLEDDVPEKLPDQVAEQIRKLVLSH
ncbi:alpha/beta hydrolase [Planktothrix sp. FACHB-1355]|uniref:Alpha/beta hydrolase n=1 Tax=Aerosakkonema funiforme FACHB-1375 TaxID=2949571 RepID=A0A926VE53_9CYAN|nr:MULTISPECIES: alpha/beta hydrolase [Oscillatoriales]MBD2182215.1 alpha/beta hydrolase [Aerosakkonema funiforme FACHB-1375]MBD3558891.1 alpha/beta hydrolase [Planktothrix sp. FACHB-1355]